MTIKSLVRLLTIVTAVTVQLSASAQAATYSFEQFAVSSVYNGKTRLPDFSGRDKKYKDYRTRIRNGLKEGPTFAGQYSVIQIGCGTGCSFAFIANNKSGQVFEFPRGGEDNLYMQLSFNPKSRLLIAQWGNYETDSCNIEYFEWTGQTAKLLETRKIGSRDACYGDIQENLRY
jgi:hypothetical protein